MDPIIKARMRQDIIVKPFIKIIKGDKVFGEPITYKGYAVPKSGTVITLEGIEEKVTTAVYLDETAVGKININDEMQIPFGVMQPIKAIYVYPGIYSEYELMEVRL